MSTITSDKKKKKKEKINKNQYDLLSHSFKDWDFVLLANIQRIAFDCEDEETYEDVNVYDNDKDSDNAGNDMMNIQKIDLKGLRRW